MDISNKVKPVLMRNFNKTNIECKGLEKVAYMSRKEIIQSIQKAEIFESGYYIESVAGKWEKFNSNTHSSKEKILVAALNNIDNSYITICLLERDPVSVFEGMAITGLANHISKGILYIPEEKSDLKKELEKALEKIDLNGFCIRITMGKVNVSELDENALVHHIETLASISAYFNLGADFVQTRIVAVTGAVKTPAIGEVNAKASVKEIIEHISGGIDENVKAIILGGKMGICIVYEEAAVLNFQGYGNSEIIVLKNGTCIVDFAKQGMDELYEKTCGKCTFCREGTYQLQQILSDASKGKGKADDIEHIEELTEQIPEETLCSFGKSGVNFLQTSMHLFRGEYESHIKRKKCLTGTCQVLVIFAIAGDKCDSCGECIDVCEYDAIEGEKGFIHMIDEFDCTKCGKCIDVCPNNAILRIPSNKTIGPDKLTRVGKWKKR